MAVVNFDKLRPSVQERLLKSGYNPESGKYEDKPKRNDDALSSLNPKLANKIRSGEIGIPGDAYVVGSELVVGSAGAAQAVSDAQVEKQVHNQAKALVRSNVQEAFEEKKKVSNYQREQERKEGLAIAGAAPYRQKVVSSALQYNTPGYEMVAGGRPDFLTKPMAGGVAGISTVRVVSYKEPAVPKQVVAQPKITYTPFEQAVKGYEKRQARNEKFWEPYDRTVRGVVTIGGRIAAPEERSKWSPTRATQLGIEGLAGMKKLVVVGPAIAVDKAQLFGRGLVANRKGTLRETFVDAPMRASEVYKDPATYMIAGAAATGAVVGIERVRVTTRQKGMPVDEWVKADKQLADATSLNKIETRGWTVGLKAGSHGKVLFGKGENGWQRGTPTVNLRGAEPMTPVGPLSTKAVMKSFKEQGTPESAARMQADFDVIRMTEKTKSKYLTGEFTRNVETLNYKGVENVLGWTRKNKGEAYGSFAAQSQMATFGARTPADIDLFLRMSDKKASPKVDKLVRRLNRSGNTARRQGNLIETWTPQSGWRHAVDIHTLDSAPNALSPGGATRAYGFSMDQGRIKVEGIKAMRLSEQGVRKGASIMTIREGKAGLEIGPEAHRMKDVGDFFLTQEVLLRSRGAKPKEMAKLEKAKSLYPKELMENARVKLELTNRSPRLRSVRSPPISLGSDRLGSRGLRSPSPSISPSISTSISPSMSRSLGISPSPSISRSISPSRSVVSSISISPSMSHSLGISPSPSISRSISPSKSLSPSVSISPSISRGMSSPPFVPLFALPPTLGGEGRGRRLGSLSFGRKYRYTPDLRSVLLNIRGRTPRGRLTGLEDRPIRGGKLGRRQILRGY